MSFYRPSHVVVVVEENKNYSQIFSGSSAPYIQALARGGALLTDYYAVTHPSEPNYQALFAGSTLGLTSDACPVNYNHANLGSELRSHGHSFVGYAESLPYAGSKVCTTSAGYARRHCPWVNFTNLPGGVSQPFTAFPADYTKLPALSFVIPNVNNDMHDGTIAQGDSWLRNKLGRYASWSRTHNSLLVVVWDESETSGGNHVGAIVYGARVIAGHFGTHLTHYSALRLLEDMYGLPRLGYSATAAAVPKIFS